MLPFFCTTLPVKKIKWQCPKEERISLHGFIAQKWSHKETLCDHDQKFSVFKKQISAPKPFVYFHSKSKWFFQLPVSCPVHPWLTTLLLPWTSSVAPTMRTLVYFKTDLDDLLVPERFQSLHVKLKDFKKSDNKDFHRVQKLKNGEAGFNSSSCEWGNSWSGQQKFLLEIKTYPQWWYQQCTKSWMTNSDWFTR